MVPPPVAGLVTVAAEDGVSGLVEMEFDVVGFQVTVWADLTTLLNATISPLGVLSNSEVLRLSISKLDPVSSSFDIERLPSTNRLR